MEESGEHLLDTAAMIAEHYQKMFLKNNVDAEKFLHHVAELSLMMGSNTKSGGAG